MKQPEDVPPATVDITIAPDGQVFVFGLSREVLEIVSDLNPHDQRLRGRLSRLRQIAIDRIVVSDGATLAERSLLDKL
jgi:hypothetical protein